MASKAPPPSSMRPAAGVPSGGNGKFIAIAVLLVGGIAAVIGWKTCSKPTDPPLPPVLADAAPPKPTKNPDDDIPPPPVVEDAAAADDAGKKPGVIVMSNQCDAKTCTGASTSDVETALAFRAKQSHRCYDNALSQDPTLRGKMSISVRIGANGQVCSASATNNELASNPGVAQCVVTNFRSGAFPAPKGGCVDVSIPINFVPRQWTPFHVRRVAFILAGAGAVGLVAALAAGCGESRNPIGDECLRGDDCLSGICSSRTCIAAPPLVNGTGAPPDEPVLIPDGGDAGPPSSPPQDAASDGG